MARKGLKLSELDEVATQAAPATTIPSAYRCPRCGQMRAAGDGHQAACAGVPRSLVAFVLYDGRAKFREGFSTARILTWFHSEAEARLEGGGFWVGTNAIFYEERLGQAPIPRWDLPPASLQGEPVANPDPYGETHGWRRAG